MKKTTTTLLRFVVFGSLIGSITSVAYAQQTPKADKSGDIHVKVIERMGGTVTEIDRTYRADAMTDDKRDEVVKNLVDSLKMARKGDGRQRQMTIIIEDDADVNTRTKLKNRRPNTRDGIAGMPRPGNQRNQPFQRNRDFRYQFRADIDSVGDRLKQFNFMFPHDLSLRLMQPFDAWSRDFSGKPATVRGLEAYPNNPDRKLLNVRFSAPAKGDVIIVVTNTKGKEVARKEVNGFSGEYVGQIDLGKNAPGTYFITVTQNEDGAVRRIVVE